MHYLSRALLLALLSDITWSSAYGMDSFLSDSAVSKGLVQDALEHQPTRQSACQKTVRCVPILLCKVVKQNASQTTGPIETTLCDYETLESVNGHLFNSLHELVGLPFFRYFQVCFLVNAYISR
jgi:hypothetical protein